MAGVATSNVVSILTAESLKPAEVAAMLKCSRKALANMRLERQGPPFELKARGVVVYPVESLYKVSAGAASYGLPGKNRPARSSMEPGERA